MNNNLARVLALTGLGNITLALDLHLTRPCLPATSLDILIQLLLFVALFWSPFCFILVRPLEQDPRTPLLLKGVLKIFGKTSELREPRLVKDVALRTVDTNDAITIGCTKAIANGINKSKFFINTCCVRSTE